MNRATALILVALVTLASDANGQIRRQTTQGPPAYWFSAGAGAFSANSVSDGESGTTWDFGNATSLQYRASLEKAFSNGIGVGLAGTYVKAPIRYSNFRIQDVPAGETCGSCDADVDVYSLAINFEAGGGQGFHQVYGASAGMTRYDNFKRKSDDVDLTPTSAVDELSGTFSYGFGYRLSPRTVITGVYEIGLVYHSRDGLTSDQRNTLIPRTIRVSLRQGFGAQGSARRRR